MTFFPSGIPFSEGHIPYLAAYGEMFVNWNRLESSIRNMLATISREPALSTPLGALILTAELGGAGLENALNAFALTKFDGEMTSAIVHTTKAYAHLRGHRNYYAHSIMWVIKRDDGSYQGMASQISARGKLAENRDDISIEKINWLSNECFRLDMFVGQITTQYLSEFLGSEKRSLPQPPSMPPPIVKQTKQIHATPQ